MNINIPKNGYNGTFRSPRDDFEGKDINTDEVYENESDISCEEEEYEESETSSLRIQKSKDTGDVIYNAINNSKIVNKIAEDSALSNIVILTSVVVVAIMGVLICAIMAGA